MPTQNKRVAVIAIHGVGHHESGATAQAVTDLLAGVETGSIEHPRNRYGTFSLQQVQIALPPAENPFRETDPAACSSVEPEKKSKKSIAAIFDERRGAFQTLYKLSSWLGEPNESETHKKERYESARTLDIAREFMNVQLQEFKGDESENSYTTWRHAGYRLGANRMPEKEVHVYEMFWADLARPNNSLVRFLFSFYQLLLHLVSLGRIAVDQASYENLGKLDWLLYVRSYTYSARLLSLAVLPLLVLIYGVALAPVPLLLTGNTLRAVLCGIIVGIAGILGVLYLSLKNKPLLRARSWWFWILPSIVPGVALVWTLLKHGQYSAFALVSLWWIIGGVVTYWIFIQYDQVRNGAKQTGLFFILMVTAAFFLVLIWQGSCDEIALKTTSILLVQYVFLVLRFLIVLFIVSAVFSVVMEFLCRFRLRLQKKQEELARTRAAGRTARFGMAIPALLILFLAVFTGSATYHFVNKYGDVYKDAAVESIPVPQSLKWMVLSPEDIRELLRSVRHSSGADKNVQSESSDLQAMPVHSAHKILEGLIVESAPPGMIVTGALAAVGFLILAMIVLPSVYFELFPERAATNGAARLLGNWLAAGFRNFRWSVMLIWIAIFLVPFVFMAYGLWAYGHDPNAHGSFLLYFYTLPWMAAGEGQLLTAGGLIAGSAVVLAGVLVKYLSAVLDTILDVDTYLRTSPEKSTPRALIAERYIALIRHIHSCKEADDSYSYDHIVIVAHSLGSLITADLLRFLHSGCMPSATKYAFAGPESKSLPIYFFSMGCPLRQLLNRFFPNLYKWVSEIPEDTGFIPETSNHGKPIPPETHPFPGELNLRQWINYYRSGDYVGRSVWANDVFGRTSGADDAGKYPHPFVPDIYHDQTVPSARVDACIGLGAHTHYWDRTAPDVSTQLDTLITM